ncbi:probable ribosomal protein S11, mitochondrial [Tanacetum coccineum]|uniref:Probable ribosomal protein S11, mitochondrial n=1 Tax=Tanacetum coccineum TaxID=301880 RepID=A0ABQ4WW29_9ASTR
MCRTSGLYAGSTRVLHNAMSKFLGSLGMKFGFAQAHSIHSAGPNEFERRLNNGLTEPERKPGIFEDLGRRLDNTNRTQPPINTGPNPGFFEGLSRRLSDIDRTRAPNETGGDSRPFGRGFGSSEGRNVNLLRGITRDNQNENYRSGLEQNADIVHVKIMRNNTFVTVTDSKGNKKMGASAGSLAEMSGGPKVSKYSAEATAEHVGRVAKSMGLKSVVMKVNGFTHFKRKKLAILSFRDGYTNSRSDKNPIVYIEDTTRKPHNGCRLRKQRRV